MQTMLGLSTILPPGDPWQPRTASGSARWWAAFWLVIAAILGGVAFGVPAARGQDCDGYQKRAAQLFAADRQPARPTTEIADDFAPAREAGERAKAEHKYVMLWIDMAGKFPDLRRELSDVFIHADLKRQYRNETAKSGGPRLVFVDIAGNEFFVLERNIQADAAFKIREQLYKGGFPGTKPKAVERVPGRPALSEELRYVPPPPVYVVPQPLYLPAPEYTYFPAQPAGGSLGVGASLNIGRFNLGVGAGADCTGNT
jgi:hypothetical protein